MKLRKAGVSDSVFIFRTRNDKVSRQNSTNQQRIEFGEHSRWIRRTLQKKQQTVFLIIESGNGSVGYVRINKSKSSISQEISISINPVNRGLGICGEVLFLLGLEYWRLGEIVVANVWSRNKSSLKCFLRAGFRVTRVSRGFVELRLLPTPP